MNFTFHREMCRVHGFHLCFTSHALLVNFHILLFSRVRPFHCLRRLASSVVSAVVAVHFLPSVALCQKDSFTFLRSLRVINFLSDHILNVFFFSNAIFPSLRRLHLLFRSRIVDRGDLPLDVLFNFTLIRHCFGSQTSSAHG
jgi:hypothetical protein